MPGRRVPVAVHRDGGEAVRTARRLCCVVIAIAALCCVLPPAALAAWSAQGTGSAAGAATTMPTGSQPAGSANVSSVTVRWPAATMANGALVAGYIVNRYNAVNGAAATVGAGCSGVVTTTTCTEQSVPAGTWVYTDTPVQLSWTGGRSPASAPIVVP